MDLTLIVASLAMGLAVAAPFGPVNIMVIRATLRRGLTGGLVAGAGALTADGSFAAVAAYGLSTVEHFFIAHATVLTLAGGALLVGFGIITARAHFSAADLTTPPESPSATQLWRKAAATFSATVTNPPALFGNLVVFGTMAGVLRLGAAPWRPAVAVAGFAVGGSLWWSEDRCGGNAIGIETVVDRFFPGIEDVAERHPLGVDGGQFWRRLVGNPVHVIQSTFRGHDFDALSGGLEAP
ncbi:MAG: LysE family transporter [Rhizobiales bacterium]|nr:LysE family transporter [Hyphomicrobiales bacterium]